MRRNYRIAVIASVVIARMAAADPFTFSGAAAEKEAAALEQEQRIRQLLSVPCQQKSRNHRIMVVVAERTSTGWDTAQQRYVEHFDTLNSRLQSLGLQTYTQQQIQAQIARAELDAYFRNDPDAALAASRRLGANHILRVAIQTHADVNRRIGSNEVAVTLELTLSSASGRVLSHVSARAESYAGTDVRSMAAILVQEQAEELIARLYNDYCRRTGSKH